MLYLPFIIVNNVHESRIISNLAESLKSYYLFLPLHSSNEEKLVLNI